MKRLKQLIVITLVAVMAFSLAACDSSCSSSKLSELLVNSQNAKTEFYVGEEYSSEGLVVTAVYGEDTATLTSSDYVIDSSAYDSTTAGTYKIDVSYTEGKNEVSNSYNVKVIVAPITSLTVNTSGATIEYLVGDALDLSGITATAVFADENEETLSYSDLTVDTSAIDMYTAGDYKVTVSYTRGGATKSDEFVVSVLSHSTITASLSVTKTTVDYNVESATGVSVDISDIAVYFVDEDGVSETALESGKYELKCFKGDTEIEIPATGSLTLTEGKYQIWAYMEYTLPDLTDADDEEYTYTLKDFVFINVYDEVSSIALSNASTGTFTQEAGGDEVMSSTWEYTLTYASGYTETIYGTDANLSYSGLATTSAVSGATATVTYTKVYADGSTKNVSCEVTYSISAKASGAQTYTYNMNTLTAAPDAGTALIDGVLYTIGSPAYGTNGRSHSDLAEETLSGRLQINASANGFKIVLTEAATITVYAQSSSGSEARALALYDYTNDTKGDMVGSSAAVGVSTADNDLNKCVFTTESAGTYCLFSTSSSVNVFYIVVEVAASVSTYSYNLNTLTAAPDAGTALVDSVLYTIGSPAYGTNGRSHSDLAEETLSGRLQINASANGFKIVVTGAATITVYAQSSSGSEARALALYDYTDDTKGNIVGSSAAVGVSTADNELDKCVFTTESAGTYCLFSTSSSVNVFYIIIEF